MDNANCWAVSIAAQARKRLMQTLELSIKDPVLAQHRRRERHQRYGSLILMSQEPHLRPILSLTHGKTSGDDVPI
ncbi:hypothetical protein, partial [Novosphingobium sediminis]|uniref:hypothetical protein n=1 Tax=Novosphingobium sediminis TaxID=707214 RepID=UPI001C3FE287